MLLGSDCSPKVWTRRLHFEVSMRSASSSADHLSGQEKQNEIVPRISATQHLWRMRGGSQSHLMRCSNGELYVVKFLNNPQHARVLANEALATGLADLVGLPVPQMALVWVDDFFIQQTPSLCVTLGNKAAPCQGGLQYGSRYVINPLDGRIFDIVPTEHLDRVRNLVDFVGMLAFDKWTGNVDNRQATFWRKSRQKNYTATFIDQGHCFNVGEWTFPDKPRSGIYQKTEVYRGVEGWHSFEPWLSRIETMDESSICSLGRLIPPDWSIGAKEVSSLLEKLCNRRSMVRDLICAFRFSDSKPFPNWR